MQMIGTTTWQLSALWTTALVTNIGLCLCFSVIINNPSIPLFSEEKHMNNMKK